MYIRLRRFLADVYKLLSTTLCFLGYIEYAGFCKTGMDWAWKDYDYLYSTNKSPTECLEWCGYEIQSQTCAYSNYSLNYTGCAYEPGTPKGYCYLYVDAPITGGELNGEWGDGTETCWAVKIGKLIKLTVSMFRRGMIRY